MNAKTTAPARRTDRWACLVSGLLRQVIQLITLELRIPCPGFPSALHLTMLLPCTLQEIHVSIQSLCTSSTKVFAVTMRRVYT